MRLKCVVAGTGLLLATLGLGTIALAQEEPVAPASGQEDQEGKMPFALYVEVAIGSMTADDIEAGIQTLTSRYSETTLSLEDQTFARVALGWKLPNEKGDVRFRFDGYKEDGYTLKSTGFLANIDPDQNIDNSVAEALPWWGIDIVDGNLTATRTPPIWDGDLNGNDVIDPDEVSYPAADRILTSGLTTDLQNRVQTYDLLYGRKFGTRKIEARWWAGLRYFTYEGNVPATAWLLSTTITGFTEGALLPLLSISQESNGLGPTGVMETRFKFLDESLAFYVRAQAAFMVSDLKADSGPFSSLAAVQNDPFLIPVPARLAVTRNKSTWNTAAELGVRYVLRNGVQLEAAYNQAGFLDAIIMPDQIQIPDNPQEAAQGTSALYSTQDITFDGWRAGVAFQF